MFASLRDPNLAVSVEHGLVYVRNIGT